jgi:antitoxin PrlF
MGIALRATLRGRGQVTLPADVREALRAQEGDELEFEVTTEPGVVLIRVLHMIPADQAWFWTPEWQEGERQASEDIAAGRLSGPFKDADALFDHLDKAE